MEHYFKVACVFAGIMVGLFNYELVRVIVYSQVKKVSVRMQIAEDNGDLTERIELKGDDEISILVKQFNSFLNRLSDIVSGLKQSTFALQSAFVSLVNVADNMDSNSVDMREKADRSQGEIESLNQNIFSIGTVAKDFLHNQTEYFASIKSIRNSAEQLTLNA